MNMNEPYFVQFIMNYILSEFGLFKVNYNNTNDKWNIEEVKAILIQEDG
jgi:hypothetical protein